MHTDWKCFIDHRKSCYEMVLYELDTIRQGSHPNLHVVNICELTNLYYHFTYKNAVTFVLAGCKLTNNSQ